MTSNCTVCHRRRDREFAATLLMVVVINVIDAAATWAWLKHGLATEANPLMRLAIEAGPATFFIPKVVVVAAGCTFLWAVKSCPLARRAFRVPALAYGAVAVVHLYGLALLMAL